MTTRAYFSSGGLDVVSMTVFESFCGFQAVKTWVRAPGTGVRELVRQRKLKGVDRWEEINACMYITVRVPVQYFCYLDQLQGPALCTMSVSCANLRACTTYCACTTILRIRVHVPLQVSPSRVPFIR